ncbi:hypothetical protein B0H14DRAFT_2567915 [Mycena olivaceomarginata]|nr:hypothetical protein B0H14DRAFT_2567915 [Mycena olivaceomarginata]
MFNPVIKIHGRHISSVLQSFTIQMVLTVDICFTYSIDDLSNFHQISLDSQPGSNKPTAGRLVSELSRMVEDLFSPDNYELGILLCWNVLGFLKRCEGGKTTRRQPFVQYSWQALFVRWLESNVWVIICFSISGTSACVGLSISDEHRSLINGRRHSVKPRCIKLIQIFPLREQSDVDNMITPTSSSHGRPSLPQRLLRAAWVMETFTVRRDNRAWRRDKSTLSHGIWKVEAGTYWSADLNPCGKRSVCKLV